MFDVLLLKNKPFMFFSFWVHTSWPAQQESGSQLAASRKCSKPPHWGPAALRAGCVGRKCLSWSGLGSRLPAGLCCEALPLLTLVAHVEMPLLLGISLSNLQSGHSGCVSALLWPSLYVAVFVVSTTIGACPRRSLMRPVSTL